MTSILETLDLQTPDLQTPDLQTCRLADARLADARLPDFGGLQILAISTKGIARYNVLFLKIGKETHAFLFVYTMAPEQNLFCLMTPYSTTLYKLRRMEKILNVEVNVWIGANGEAWLAYCIDFIDDR